MSKKVARAIFFILSHNVLRPSRVGGIIGLALAAVCSFGAGEAAAQYCPQTLSPPLGVPGGSVPGFFVEGDRALRLTRALATMDIPTLQVSCPFPRTTNRDFSIGVRNPRIFINEEGEPGIYASHAGTGQLAIYVHALDPQGRPIHPDPLDYATHAVRTRMNPDDPYFGSGDESYGVHAEHTGEGIVGIDFRDLSLSTTGNRAYGIFAQQRGPEYTWENGMARLTRGAVVINVIETERDRASRVRPMLATRGDYSDVIRATIESQGHIAVTVEGYLLVAGDIVPTDPDALRPDYSVVIDDIALWDASRSCLVSRLNDDGSCDRTGVRLRVDGVVAYFSGVSSQESRGIFATHPGLGDVRIRTTDSIIMTWGDESQGIYGTHTGRRISALGIGGQPVVTPGGGAVSIDVTGGSIVTQGQASYGVWGRHRGVGEVDIDLTDASVATAGLNAYGVFGLVQQCLGRPDATQCDLARFREDLEMRDTPIEGSGVGNIAIDVRGGSIVTAGEAAYAVYGRHENEGDIAIRLTGGATAATRGDGSHGVFADHRGSKGDVAVTLEAASVITEADVVGVEGSLIGVFASRTGGTGNVAVTVGPGSTVRTMGSGATGVFGSIHTGGTGDLEINVRGGSVTTTGPDATGVGGSHTGSGNVVIDVGDRSTIAATGPGVLGTHTGTGNLEINVRDASVTTTTTAPDTDGLVGYPTAAVYGIHTGTGDLEINVQGGSVTATATEPHLRYGTGVYGTHDGSGTLAINIRDASITVPENGDGDGIRASISNEDDVTVAVTVDQDSSVRGDRFGVRVFVEGTDGTTTTGGTGAGVRSDGLGAVMVAGMGSPVPTTHELRHFQVTNHGIITGREVGVRLEPGGSVVNRGRITGKIGIQAGGGSTVENSGAIISTDGVDGTSIHFDPGNNVLRLLPGTNIVGDRVQGVCGEGDTLDFSGVSPAALGSLICINDDGTPGDEFTMFRPQGKGRFICIGEICNPMDTTAFALADDMLSDLTGSIHAAVIGNGLQAHAGEGDPARTRVWAAPFGGAREQNGPGWLEDGTHYFGGGMLGAGWGTTTHVGLFVGGSVGSLDVRRMTGDRRTIDMQTVFGGVYARQDLGDVRLDARLLMGRMDHDSTRRGGRQGSANVEYTSIFLSPEVGVATRIPLMSRLHATPRLRVRYAGLFTEGFRERSRGLSRYDVQFAKRDVHVLEARGEVGIPIALPEGGRIEPRVGIEGRWLAAGDTIDVMFLNGGSRVVDVGGDTSVATGTVGVGLTLPVVDSTSLVGNFDGAYTTEEAWRATGYLGLVYSF